MPAQVTNYKCPACTGPLHFVGSSGRLECDYCGSNYSVAEIEAHMREEEAKAAEAYANAQANGDGWDTPQLENEWGEEAANLRAYNCPSCGAELICDVTTAATSCPYCNNPTVVPGQLSGVLKPDYVIPFRYSKEQALDALKKHYKGKPFLPKAFTDKNHIEEIKGVYVPFWLFDGVAEADIEFDGRISHTRRSGNYEITTTEHYQIVRSGSIGFSHVPVDASTKMPDHHMDSIEPYDYNEMRPFSTAYLPGFLADKFDVSAADCAPRADIRCKNTVIEALRKTVSGYTSVVLQHEDVQLHRGNVKYALMPVWMLNTKWKDKTFLFAMNGQSGKIVGDLPISKGKWWATFAAIAAPIAAVLAAILFLM